MHPSHSKAPMTATCFDATPHHPPIVYHFRQADVSNCTSSVQVLQQLKLLCKPTCQRHTSSHACTQRRPPHWQASTGSRTELALRASSRDATISSCSRQHISVWTQQGSLTASRHCCSTVPHAFRQHNDASAAVPEPVRAGSASKLQLCCACMRASATCRAPHAEPPGRLHSALVPAHQNPSHLGTLRLHAKRARNAHAAAAVRRRACGGTWPRCSGSRRTGSARGTAARSRRSAPSRAGCS